MAVISELSYALGSGTGAAMLWFPITYYAMRKQFKLKPLFKLWRSFWGCVVLFAILYLFFGVSVGDTPASVMVFMMLPIVVSASMLYWTSRENEGITSKHFSFIKSTDKPKPTAMQQAEQNRYPRWLNHLQSPVKRIMYATLPFLLIWSSVMLIDSIPERNHNNLPDFSSSASSVPDINDFSVPLDPTSERKLLALTTHSKTDEALHLIFAFLVLTVGAYALLTVAHLVAGEYKPWRERSRLFRLYIFFASCWAVGVVVFMTLFYPYGHDNWSYMNADDYLHLFSVALVPPIFIGIAMYLYRKYIS